MSVAGLMLKLRKIIETGRLEVVGWCVLFGALNSEGKRNGLVAMMEISDRLRKHEIPTAEP